MAAEPYPFMTTNPYNSSEIWMVDINSKRWITSSEEYGAWSYIGCPVLHIGTAWFNSIPNA